MILMKVISETSRAHLLGYLSLY